ncbi:MAG: hypothetical protein RIR46_367 [Actinomycetota bacterium]|jgi:hypothetical protein
MSSPGLSAGRHFAVQEVGSRLAKALGHSELPLLESVLAGEQ